MDSEGFVKAIEDQLTPIAEIMRHVIKKQLGEIGATRDSLTPVKAEQLIERVCDAMEMFVGPEGRHRARQLMYKEFRRYAPEHFKDSVIF